MAADRDDYAKSDYANLDKKFPEDEAVRLRPRVSDERSFPLTEGGPQTTLPGDLPGVKFPL